MLCGYHRDKQSAQYGCAGSYIPRISEELATSQSAHRAAADLGSPSVATGATSLPAASIGGAASAAAAFAPRSACVRPGREAPAIDSFTFALGAAAAARSAAVVTSSPFAAPAVNGFPLTS